MKWVDIIKLVINTLNMDAYLVTGPIQCPMFDNTSTCTKSLIH